MAEMSLDEFSNFLDAPASQEAPQQKTEPLDFNSILPASQAAVDSAIKDQQRRNLQRALRDTASPDGQDLATRLGARAGVPFDVNTGIPFVTRTRMELRRDPNEQESYLKKVYGDSNVRKGPQGNLIVTTHDQGNPKDVLVNPLGVEWGDLSSVVAQAPEIAGPIILGIATRGASFTPGIWNAVKTLAGMAAASQGMGLAKDLSVSDKPIGELSRERVGMGAVDMALGAGIGLGTKLFTKVVSPLSNYGKLQFDARNAQRFFDEEYGTYLPLTPAEATGSSLLGRAEALAMQKPGSSAPLKELMKDRSEKLSSIQKIALGGDVPDEEVLGKAALSAIGGKTAPARFEVERAGSALQQTGARELEDALTSATGVVGPVNKTRLGGAIRDTAFKQREKFRAQSDTLYNDVFSDPRTAQKNIQGDALAKEAKTLADKLPSKENLISSVDYDTYGSPIEKVTKKGQTFKEFVPEGVLSKLNALASVKGQQFRLDELMQMRREVANEIAAGEAVPGAQTRYLSQIQDMLTSRIKTGLEEIDPALLSKWEVANEAYAKGVQRFKRAGIAELFRDPEQTGFLGDTEIVARATGGRRAQDIYTSYKDFLGTGSQEMQQFRRAIADDVLSKSPLSDTIDASGFVRRIDDLAKDAPEVLKEVFGMNATKARDIAQLLRSAEGNIPEKELVEAMRSNTLSAEKLRELMSAQAKKDQLYKNSLLKSIEDGTFKAERIKPTEFVDKFSFKSEPSEIREVMSMISDQPELVEDIRRLTFKKILDKATVRSSDGDEIINATKLDQMIQNPTDAKRLKSVLGNDTFQLLEKFADFLRPGAIKEKTFQATGGLGGSQQVAKIVEQGELKYVDRALKNFALASFYTSGPVRNYFANTVIGPQGSANLVNYAIASTPFVRAVLDTYGDEKGRQMMSEIKGSLDRFAQEFPASAVTPQGAPMPAEPSLEEFERALSQ